MKVHLLDEDGQPTVKITSLKQLIELLDKYKSIVVDRTTKTIIDVPYNRETGEHAKFHQEIVPGELDVQTDFYIE